MKILQIYDLPPCEEKGTGGIEVAIMETSKELVKLGHEVTILSGASDKIQTKFIDGVRIITIDYCGLMRKTWNGNNLTFIRQLLFPIVVLFNDHAKYDIYHGHIYSSGLISIYLAKKTNSIAVNTIHGSYYPIWNKLTKPINAFFYRRSERILAPLIAKLSHMQLHTGDYFAKQVILWGAPKEKIRTIYNGVDIEKFNTSNFDNYQLTSLRDKLFLKPIPTIITARRFVKKNGLDYLIRAFKLVLEEVDAQLIIIGEGIEQKYLNNLIIGLNLQHRTRLLGFIPNKEIPAYIAISDIAVVPSLMEASSIFMLESMAMGKAVIATKIGALEEILNPSVGMLVEPANVNQLSDAMIEMIKNKCKRLYYGENAKKYVLTNFSSRIAASRIEQCYATLYKNNNS